MDVHKPSRFSGIIHGIITLTNRRNGATVNLRIVVSEQTGEPTAVIATVVQTCRNMPDVPSSNIGFDYENAIGLSDIDGGQGTGLGAVLMAVICIIGRAKGKIRFYVDNLILHKGWQRFLDEQLLVANDQGGPSDYIGAIDPIFNFCLENAANAGWDLSPLENMVPHIETIAEPDEKKKKKSGRCILM